MGTRETLRGWIRCLGLLPGVAAPALVDPTNWLAWLAGLTAMSGAAALGLVASHHDAKERKRLGTYEDLRANHDVALLMGLALRRALEVADRDESLARHGEGLAAALREVDRALNALPGSIARYLGPLEERGLAMVLAVRQRGAPQKAVDWTQLAADLRECAGGPALRLPQDVLATYLEDTVPWLAGEVMKEDAAGKTPAEGRGWAGFTLRLFARVVAEQEALRDDVASAKSALSAEITATGEQLTRLVRSRLLSLERGVLVGSGTTSAELSGLRAALGDVATRLSDFHESGLRSPEWFAREVQRVAFERLGVLRTQPGFGAVAWALVGRSHELDQTRRFLDDSLGKVLYWRAVPGVGKSRLCVAIAEEAIARGWTVRFVQENDIDLSTALAKTWAGEGDLLLIWDDYQGVAQAKMEAFLALDTPAFLPASGARAGRVKRILTGWPTTTASGFVRFSSEPDAYLRRDLTPIGRDPTSAAELDAWVARIVPRLSAEERRAMIGACEGNPRVLLAACEGVAESIGPREWDAVTPTTILDQFYARMVQRGLSSSDVGASRPAAEATLRLLALLGRVSTSPPDAGLTALLGADGENGVEALRRSALALDLDDRLALEPDSLRAWVVRASLAPGGLLSTLPTGRGLRDAFLRIPLSAFVGAWAIIRTSSSDSAPRLLAWADERRASASSAESAPLARALASATVVEPSPSVCVALADRIQALWKSHPTNEVARELAKALVNATVGENVPSVRAGLAARIEALWNRHPIDAVARALAEALFNATVGEPSPALRVGLADRIEALLTAHPTQQVAYALAKALFNATVGEPAPSACARLADRIETLWRAHPTREVAHQLARALVNATAVEPSPSGCIALAGRIEALWRAHPSDEVAQELAIALVNATVVEPSLGGCIALADRLEIVWAAHPTDEVAHELAKALGNATAVESSSATCSDLVSRIEAVWWAHPTNDVAQALATALFNATVVEPSPSVRVGLADRIEALWKAHPTEEILRVLNDAREGERQAPEGERGGG